VWNPRRTVKYTTKELLDIAAQYITNEEATGPLLVPRGREVVPGSSQAAPSDITIHGAKNDTKGGKMR
jgi:hypothetical protein